MSALPTIQPSLNITLTPEERRFIADAAAQMHKTETEFIRIAAIEMALSYKPKPELTDEEFRQLLQETQEKVRLAVPDRHQAFEDFLAERRAEAARE